MVTAYFLMETNASRKIINRNFTPYENVRDARKEAYKILKKHPNYSVGVGKLTLTKKDYMDYLKGKTTDKRLVKLEGACYVGIGVIGPITCYKTTSGKDYYLNKDGTIIRRN